MLEVYSFVSDVNAFLAELEMSFQTLEEYFPFFFFFFYHYSQRNGYRHQHAFVLICVIYICSLIFLSLDSQQNNKSIPDS